MLRLLFCLALGLTLAAPLAAQSTRPVVGLRLGAAPDVDADESKTQYVPYAELEIGMTPMPVGDTGWQMAGSAHVGTWSGRTTAPQVCTACDQLTQRSVVLGFQSHVTPPGAVLPFAFRVGISHYVTWAGYDVRFPFAGEFSETIYRSTLDLGLRFDLPLSGRLSAIADVNTAAVLLRYRESRSFADRTRWTVGASYAFR